MAYEITATKFRPQTFDTLVGQEFVSETLKNSILSGRIANAYLLSGPRGVGKTSTARIIAKALNCIHGPTATPCNVCENCKAITAGNHTDVFEIDGASNTGINEIKKIQEEIIYPPVNAKYKVYIIDEVHMLSKNAFNALLKTIEEPPKGVVFIFATTEINKVLPTIRSRCQLFNLRLIPTQTIYESLKNVLDSYNVKYDEKAIRWVAVEGKGSMRDSYTLLDQVISFCNNDITLEAIREKMGLVGEDNVKNLVLSIINKDRAKLISDYYNILSLGIAAEQLITEMIKYFRNLLFKKVGVNLDSFEYSNDENYKDVLEVFAFEDIENIIEVLFASFEKSRTSVDVKIEVESMLLRLVNYDSFIRPKTLLRQLNALKEAITNPNVSFAKSQMVPNQPQTTHIVNIPPQKPAQPVQQQHSAQTQPRNDAPMTTVGSQQQQPQNSPSVVMNAKDSDIIDLIKKGIAPTNTLLLLALDNIDKIEESRNVLTMYFSKSMYSDTASKALELLTSIVKKNINADYTIQIVLDKDAMMQSPLAQNVDNLQKIFHAKEL